MTKVKIFLLIKLQLADKYYLPSLSNWQFFFSQIIKWLNACIVQSKFPCMKNKTSVQNDKAEIPLKKPDTIKTGLQKEDNRRNLKSKSELERRKERTHNGSTKPDKNHIG